MKRTHLFFAKLILCFTVFACVSHDAGAMWNWPDYDEVRRRHANTRWTFDDARFLNNLKTWQLLVTIIKTISLTDADMQNAMGYDGKKKGVWSKIVGHCAQIVVKMLDPKEKRDWISKGGHINATFWQLAKDIEEARRIKAVGEQGGDDPYRCAELLKKYYPAEEKGECVHINEDGQTKVPFKQGIKPLVRVLELAATAGFIFSKKRTHQLWWQLAQCICDVTLRFWLKTGEYESDSFVSKMEAVSSAAVPAYDGGKAAWNISKAYYMLRKARTLGDCCLVCGERYDVKERKVAYQLSCGHWICLGCKSKATIKDGNSGGTVCPIENCEKHGEVRDTRFFFGDNERCGLAASCLDDDGNPARLLADGSNVRILPCGHYYCIDCIDRWLGTGHNTCPECRGPIEANW